MSEVSSTGQVPGSRLRGGLAWFSESLSTVVVLAILGAVAIAGHHFNWRIPKFSTLMGNGQTRPDDWCDKHKVAESGCIECQSALMPKAPETGWCKEHGIPECPYEHPEVAQLKQTPQVTPYTLEQAKQALAFTDRPTNNDKCKLHLRRIQFASKRAYEKAGIELKAARPGHMEEAVSANGEITYDQTRLARLSTRAGGMVWRVAKQIGDHVHQGEVLALVDAAEVGKAKAEFLQALVQFDLRNKTLESFRLASSGAIPESRIREAEAGFQEARIRLLTAEQALVNLGLPIRADDVKNLRPEEIAARIQFLGLPPALAGTLDPRTTTASLLPIVAPMNGVIIGREIVAGEVVDTTKVLFVMADTSKMWLTLDFRSEDTNKLSPGQPVRFHTSGNEEELASVIDWIRTAADEKTRTVKLRASLDNRAGRLRANSFGTGRVILREEKQALLVPNEAVHWEGDCYVVFVLDKDYDARASNSAPIFHVRKVRPGARNETSTEIIAGLLPKEMVAARGSGALRAELLKNNLGEG